MKLTKNRLENIENIKKIISSDDVIYFDFNMSGKTATAIYIESLSDKTMLGKQVIEPLSQTEIIDVETIVKKINLPETKTLQSVSDCAQIIIGGDSVIIFDGLDVALFVATKKTVARAVTEPPTASVLKGPREGFVENLTTNLSLVRQRLKTTELTYEKLTVGRQSSTTVGLLYISKIADEKVINSLRERIKNICVDGIIDSSYIIKSISDKNTKSQAYLTLFYKIIQKTTILRGKTVVHIKRLFDLVQIY